MSDERERLAKTVKAFCQMIDEMASLCPDIPTLHPSKWQDWCGLRNDWESDPLLDTQQEAIGFLQVENNTHKKDFLVLQNYNHGLPRGRHDIYATPQPVDPLHRDREAQKEVLLFLLGYSALKGKHFGDTDPPDDYPKVSNIPAPYWWRRYLREAFDAILNERSGDADEVGHLERAADRPDVTEPRSATIKFTDKGPLEPVDWDGEPAPGPEEPKELDSALRLLEDFVDLSYGATRFENLRMRVMKYLRNRDQPQPEPEGKE